MAATEDGDVDQLRRAAGTLAEAAARLQATRSHVTSAQQSNHRLISTTVLFDRIPSCSNDFVGLVSELLWVGRIFMDPYQVLMTVLTF